MSEEFLQAMLTGEVIAGSNQKNVSELSWNIHPKFAGVALKHLVTGADTKGKFSSHIVRIQAGCEIGEHLHPGQWELHEVLQGQGTCLIEGKTIAYAVGTSNVIPADEPHSVQARETDLYLLAEFVPALV
jgi:quercetin dioxygenase-like cupin family protein